MDLKPLDCNVVGGTIITSLGQRQADVGIKDGRIAALALPGTLPSAEKTIDASGRRGFRLSLKPVRSILWRPVMIRS